MALPRSRRCDSGQVLFSFAIAVKVKRKLLLSYIAHGVSKLGNAQANTDTNALQPQHPPHTATHTASLSRQKKTLQAPKLGKPNLAIVLMTRARAARPKSRLSLPAICTVLYNLRSAGPSICIYISIYLSTCLLINACNASPVEYAYIKSKREKRNGWV